MYELDIISITDDGIVTARMIPMEEHMYVDAEGRTIIEYSTEKNTCKKKKGERYVYRNSN